MNPIQNILDWSANGQPMVSQSKMVYGVGMNCHFLLSFVASVLFPVAFSSGSVCFILAHIIKLDVSELNVLFPSIHTRAAPTCVLLTYIDS